jgi:hypothetical protein
VATSNAFFSSPTADDRKAFYAQIEKMVHFFSKVKFGGKPIDNEMFVDMYPFVDMQIDLEMVGIDGNFALVTWRERFRYGNQTVLETHETTTAEFDMVECVPKTFDQILDTVREKEVWDTLALAKKQDERVHRFSCNVCKWPFEFAKQVNDFMVNPTPAGAVACARWFSLTTLSETYSPEALLDLAKYVKVWFEIEHSAANGNTATWTWKQFYQFDDEVQLRFCFVVLKRRELWRTLTWSGACQ